MLPFDISSLQGPHSSLSILTERKMADGEPVSTADHLCVLVHG